MSENREGREEMRTKKRRGRRRWDPQFKPSLCYGQASFKRTVFAGAAHRTGSHPAPGNTHCQVWCLLQALSFSIATPVLQSSVHLFLLMMEVRKRVMNDHLINKVMNNKRKKKRKFWIHQMNNTRLLQGALYTM